MDKQAFDTMLKFAADRVTSGANHDVPTHEPRKPKSEIDWSQRLTSLRKRRGDRSHTSVTTKSGSLVDTLQYHLPRIRPLDSIAGAVTGAGLGYASAGGDDTEEGRRKRIKRMLLGALAGAAGGNLVGDRARRYVANMLVPAGYSGLGDSGDGHLRQLVPDSPSQFIDAAIKDRPHPKFSRPLQMASETTGKTFSLPPEHLQARQELMRRAMGLPIADPDNAYFRSTGRSRYLPTETSGGVAGTYDTVGVNPRRWQQLATDPNTSPYLAKLTKRVQIVAGRPEIEGRYPALGDWLSRHGYRRKTPGVLNINDHWDFGLTPRETTTLRRQLVTPWQWHRPSNTYATDIQGGWKSKIDGVFMDNERVPTNWQHMASLVKRKLLDSALLHNNGVVFDQDFSTSTGQPIFKAGTDKTAASALRAMLKLIPTASEAGRRAFDLQLKGKTIGFIRGKDTLNGFQISNSAIYPKFQGFGLGKKMYGDLLKQLRGKPLLSDSTVSPAAQRVWRSMQSRPGSYDVRVNPAAQIKPGYTALADPETVKHYNNKLREASPTWKRLLGLGPKYDPIPVDRNSVFEATLKLPPR